METMNVFGFEISVFAAIFLGMLLSMFASICYALQKKTIAIKALYTLSVSLLPVLIRVVYCFVIGDKITMQLWVWGNGISWITLTSLICFFALIITETRYLRNLKTTLVVFIIAAIIALSGFTYMLVDLISGCVFGRIILVAYLLVIIALAIKSRKLILKNW